MISLAVFQGLARVPLNLLQALVAGNGHDLLAGAAGLGQAPRCRLPDAMEDALLRQASGAMGRPVRGLFATPVGKSK